MNDHEQLLKRYASGDALVAEVLLGYQSSIEENRALRTLLQKYVDLDHSDLADWPDTQHMATASRIELAKEAKTLGVTPNHNEDEQTA